MVTVLNGSGHIYRLEFLKNALRFVKSGILKKFGSDDEFANLLGLGQEGLIMVKNFLGVDDLSTTQTYKIDAKINEIEAEILKEKAEIFKVFKLYIFYNWRKSIGARWPGLFKGRNIRAISKNLVIFWGVKEADWLDISGRECKAIFGFGTYFVEFVPQDIFETVTFSKNITGILITKKIFDEMLASPPRILGRFERMYREYISVIPMNHILKDPAAMNFLKGIFATSLLREKKIFLQFLKNLRKASENKIDSKDFEFLSGLPEFHNKILVTEDRYSRILSGGEEALSIPGLAGYEPKLDKLDDLLRVVNLNELSKVLNEAIKKTIKLLWSFLVSLIS